MFVDYFSPSFSTLYAKTRDRLFDIEKFFLRLLTAHLIIRILTDKRSTEKTYWFIIDKTL